MVLGDGAVVVDQVVERPGHALIGTVLRHVVARTVDAVGGVGDAQTMILQLRSELYAVGESVKWLPDLSEVELCIGAAVDAEGAALVGGIFQFVDRILKCVVVREWCADGVSLFIIRYCPGDHCAHGTVVAAGTGDTLGKVVAIVLVAIAGIDGHAHGEVFQRLDLYAGVEGEAVETLSFLYALLIHIAKGGVSLDLVSATADAECVLAGDAGLLGLVGPVVAAHKLGMPGPVDPGLLNVFPPGRAAEELIVEVFAWHEVARAVAAGVVVGLACIVDPLAGVHPVGDIREV